MLHKLPANSFIYSETKLYAAGTCTLMKFWTNGILLPYLLSITTTVNTIHIVICFMFAVANNTTRITLANRYVWIVIHH
jgi:hypothetical protein